MEVLVRGQIGDLDLEQVVVVAGDVVGVNNLGQPDHRSFEGDDVRASVADEPHASEDPQTATDRGRIDQCLVTADYSGLFQSANPSQARRRREADACLPPIGHRSQGLPRSLETLGLLAVIGQPHPRREAGLTASHEYRSWLFPGQTLRHAVIIARTRMTSLEDR
jgi:hypothetical protein